MSDTNETIADIVAEKRRQADKIERDCAEKIKSGEMVSDCYARELVADIRREADRLEAAIARERGNRAKLREVVDAMMYEAFALCDSCVKPAAERGKLLAKWCNKLRAALAATEKEGGAK